MRLSFLPVKELYKIKPSNIKQTCKAQTLGTKQDFPVPKEQMPLLKESLA
jgi:hypothetical protein